MEITPERYPQAMEAARMRHQIRMQEARAKAAGALERLIPLLEERAKAAESAKDVDILVGRLQEIERVPVPELHLHHHDSGSGAGVHDEDDEIVPWEVVDVEIGNDRHPRNGDA